MLVAVGRKEREEPRIIMTLSVLFICSSFLRSSFIVYIGTALVQFRAAAKVLNFVVPRPLTVELSLAARREIVVLGTILLV